MRKSIYKKYTPADGLKKVKMKATYWFIFKNKEMLVKKNNLINVPFTSNLDDLNIIPIRTQYLGELDGYPCYSVEVGQETVATNGMVFCELKSLYELLDEDIYLLAGKAAQIINWDKNHQFCGRCGTPTETSKYERAKVCPNCGYRSFIRLSPAVITAVIKEDKILMAKHGYRGGIYGLIAGFVEPGETLEEAVERETREEVGLKVKNIRYFGSQPWPYPHSLMVAYTAEYESGNIKVDGKEIIDANWFYPDNIPRIPSKISISSDLIDWFILNSKKIKKISKLK